MTKYHAIWQEYERHNSPAPINIRFNAGSNHEALKKVFLRKAAFDCSENVEDFLESLEVSEEDLTEEYLVNYFDNIDIGGFSFLVKLTNLDTNEMVYTIGDLDEGTDEIWED